MFRNERLEMRVGLFMGIGIFLMFFIVFSIGDFKMFRKEYPVSVLFDFVNGLTDNAPVRLAGVHVGEVQSIGIYYDVDTKKTRVKVDINVTEGIKIEKDTVARINSLGLLGEQYLELTPGTGKEFIAPGDVIIGRNPVNIGQQMENMSEFMKSARKMVNSLENGEGTLGKLLTDDTLYNDLETVLGRLRDGEGTLGKLLTDDALYNDFEIILGRLRDGEGTIGKLLTDDTIYNDAESLVADIKAHPWKLLHKPSSRSRSRDDEVGDTRSNVTPGR